MSLGGFNVFVEVTWIVNGLVEIVIEVWLSVKFIFFWLVE